MQRYLIFTLFGLILIGVFGCSGSSAAQKMVVKYDVELSMVRKASDINQRYQAPVADTMDVVRYAYEDDLFRSIWSATEAGWNLVLYNKSEKPLIIDWDEVVYMDVDNIGHKVLASGTKLSERDNPQTPSVIARRGNINESLFSADHVYVSSTGILARRPLWPVDFTEAKRYEGKKVRLMIPFMVDGLSAQYEFVFTIKNVSQEASSSNPWQLYLVDRALGVNF
ncbi:MAG: hypothetical protein RBR69_01190 [Candidatus Cloacimonadaceae bacterium]|jgi:hypothetical protein|nr:hypothetical protein [Candidatus Cloacimonadota bacterium]MDY0126739.1 hypothetical protein [Candidatus Cloacimonadaceae bacterium]MCB5255678.1 hypothetical protein [Candidatus Cloacimonadota bacterium]MCK9178344.1 hypothetical protein [Candidatus Cloacimonadota bacterium]MCK9241921.1 hypothetical protein [Candidatus Cloacimonadota bacterium]